MKQALLIFGFSAVIASSLVISSPSSAKTVKACDEEWKANKATIQASGKKKKDFITECRAETASTESPAAQAAPAETPNSSATTPRTRSAKTLRACAAEWTANKETLQASGKTRKDFVVECRAGTETTAAATTAPSAGMTPTAGKKTVKACEADWKANKAAIQASGKKKTDFMTECRAEPGSTETAAQAPQSKPAEQPKPEVATQSTTTAQPKSAAAPQPTTPAQPRSEATKAPAPQAPTASLATGQFTTEADAKSHCPGDTVVWANTRSRVYHYATSRRYGHTKLGAFMCEKETAAAGMRAAKRERRL